MSRNPIVTDFVHPPIPVRHCDWAAWYDGDEPDDNGHMRASGQGRTEREAVIDLIENHPRPDAFCCEPWCGTCGVRLTAADTAPCSTPACPLYGGRS